MTTNDKYMMENAEEAFRLEIKTDSAAVTQQAQWGGVKPGMRVLDAGCGPGITTSILNQEIQPNGEILGIDYSKERIEYANEHYGVPDEIDFQIHDLRKPLQGLGMFDLIWVRFVLEYNRKESKAIINNLTKKLKPGGTMCLLDLDYNCLSHYELSPKIEKLLFAISNKLEKENNFDPYSGRKLYSYLYDKEFQDIKVDMVAHHLFYGDIRKEDLFNWAKKVEVTASRIGELFDDFPGGYDSFIKDFYKFFLDPRRFTYTPLILCKGIKPDTSKNT